MPQNPPSEAKWTAHHRVGLYPEWEIEEEVHAGVRSDGIRVLADIVATIHGEGDLARARAELIVAAPATAQALESERALNAELVEALKAVNDEAVFLNGLASGNNMAVNTVKHVTDRVHTALAKAEAREKGDA